MKPVFDFLVEPVDGMRYDNVLKSDGVEFVVSVSQEDHTVTQRHAKLIETPVWYQGELQPGDTVIVHHNVFRKMYDMKGREVSSNSHIRDNWFLVGEDRIYMYKRGDSDWTAISPFIFISPVENDEELFEPDVLKQLWGRVEYSPVSEYQKGDLISFQPDSEYEFRIDDRVLYRMFLRNLTLIES